MNSLKSSTWRTLGLAMALVLMLAGLAAAAVAPSNIQLISAKPVGPEMVTTVEFKFDGDAAFASIEVVSGGQSYGAGYSRDAMGNLAVTSSPAAVKVFVSTTEQKLYDLVITLHNDAGQVTKTFPLVLWVDYTAPTAPSALDAVTPTQNRRPVWYWEAATDAHSGVDFYELALGAHSFTTTGLQWSPSADLLDGLHTLKVRAVDKAGNRSSWAELAVIVDNQPAAPPAVKALPAFYQGTSVNVSWPASVDAGLAGVKDYDLRWYAGGVEIGSTGWIPETSYTVTGLTAGTEYEFKVRVRDRAHNLSGFGAEAKTTPIVTGPILSNAAPVYTNLAKPLISIDVVDTGVGLAAKDPVKIAIPSAQIDAVMTAGAGASYTYQVGKDLASGTYEVTVTATDKFGVVSTQKWNMVINNQAPTITNLAPVAGTIFKDGNVTISASFVPATGMVIEPTSAEIKVNGVSVTASATVTAAGFTYNAVGLAAGTVNVEVSGLKDKANNAAATAKWSFVVDQTGPAISDLTPADNSLTAKRQPVISAKITDPAGIDLEKTKLVLKPTVGVDPAAIALTQVTWANNILSASPVEELADGAYAVTLETMDKVGNKSTQAWTFTVDATNPVIAVVQPLAGVWITTTAPVVKVTADDTHQILKPRMVVAGSELTVTRTGNEFSGTASALPQGPVAAAFYIQDEVGNNSELIWSFNVDSVPPAVVADSIKPAAGATVTARRPEISIKASDATSGIKVSGVEVLVGGIAQPFAASYDGTTLTLVPTVDIPDGLYTYQIVIPDVAGNVRTFDSSLTVAADKPVASNWSWVDNQWTNQTTYNLGVDLQAAGARTIKADSIVLKINGETKTHTWNAGTGRLSFQATGLVDGTYVISITAADNLGNTATFQRTLKVDTVRPEIAILVEPLDGGWTSATPDLVLVLTDDNSGIDLTKTELWINHSKVTPTYDAKTGKYSYSVPDFPALNVYHVLAIAVDNANNQRSTSWSFNVDRTKPVISATKPTGPVNQVRPTISAQFADPLPGVNPASAKILVNGTDVTAKATVTATGFSYVPESNLAEGDYTVAVSVKDGFGNESTANWAFKVDLTNPVLTAVNPKNGDISNVVRPALKATATDANGIASVTVSLNGGAKNNATLAAGEWGWTPAADLSSGTHTAVWEAKDSAGNTTTLTVTWTIDTVKPTISNFSPGQGTTARSTVVGLQASVADAHSGLDLTTLVVTIKNDYEAHPALAKYEAVVPHTFDAATGRVTAITAKLPLASITDPTKPNLFHAEINVMDKAGNAATPLKWSFWVTDESPIISDPKVDGVDPLNLVISKVNPVITATIAGDVTWARMTINGTIVPTTFTGGVLRHQPTSLAEGIHKVEVTAADGANQAWPVNFEFGVDRTGPVIHSHWPGEFDTQPIATKTPTVTAVVSDFPAGVASVEARIDGGAWTAVPFTSADLTEGRHTIQVRATDNVGNVTTNGIVEFVVDVTAPVVTVTGTPAVTKDGVTITGSLDDGGTAINMASIKLTAAGKPVPFDYTVAGTKVNISAAVSGLAEGVYPVVLEGKDGAGNTASATWSFTVDKTAPTLAIVSPAKDALLNNKSVTVQASVGDASTATMTINGVTKTATLAGGNLTLTEDFADGKYNVKVVAADQAGNSASLEWSFTVDTTPPVLAVISPADKALINTRNVVISASVGDAETASLSIGGAVQADAKLVDGVISVAKALADGVYSITVVGTDKAGNSKSLAWEFEVDATAPVITDLMPRDGHNTRHIHATIGATYSDNKGVVVSSVVLTLNGVDITAESEVTASGIIYNKANMADGIQNVSLSIADKAGNVTTKQWSFLVDNTAPVIEIVGPQGKINNSKPVVSANVLDAGVGLDMATLELKLNGSKVTPTYNATTGLLSYQVPGILGDGSHTVALAVADRLGNASSKTWNFTVDTIPPGVPTGLAVVETIPGRTQGPDVEVKWTQQPDAVSFVLQWTQDSTWSTFSSQAGITENKAVVAGLAAGTWYFRVRSVDDVGNVSGPSSGANTVVFDPLVVAITSPAADELFNKSSVTVTANVGTATSATLKINGEVASSTIVNGVISVTKDLADGNYTVVVDATDNVGGGFGRAERSFNVDTTAPVLSIISPAANALFNKAIEYTVEAGVGDAVVASMTINGVAQAATLANGKLTVAKAFAEGTYTVVVTAKDQAGNEATIQWNFTVDTTAPVLSVISPIQGAVVNKSQATNLSIQAGVGDAVEASMTINGVAQAATLANGKLTATKTLTDGSYTVVVTAKDLAGNQATTQWTFTVDATPPTITSMWPANDATVSTTKSTVSFAVAGHTTLVLVVDGKTVNPADYTVLGGKVIYAPSTPFSAGKHTVKVTAADSAGNVTVVETSFTVDLYREGFGFGRLWF